MSELRSRERRKADALTVLEGNPGGWLATASDQGGPHLIPVSVWWDAGLAVVATRSASRTARNLESTGTARLGIGSPDDVVMLDLELVGSDPVANAPDLESRFTATMGWDPADEGPDWSFFRFRPIRIQVYQGYGELKGREVMRNGAWLA
jgi:hypothetical protein